jgi:Anti sigma-E protein RseA, N-terminal domain
MTGSPDATDAIVARDANVREFHREQLSAMMDGALSADETKFLLRRMEHDDALADCWERWQFLGDAMRGHAGRALPADFSRRVGRAIADDLAAGHQQQVAAVASGAQRPLLRWGGGAALAASVALAALIGTRSLSSPGGDAPAAVASASMPSAVVIPTPVASGVAPSPLSSPVPQPSITDAGTVVAAAAVASATASRRAAHPRILAGAEALAASAAASSTSTAAVLQASASPGDVAATNSLADAQTEITSKPWPKALVPGASFGGGVNAGYAGVDGLELHALPSQPAQPQLQTFPGMRQQSSEHSNEGESSSP